MAVITQTIQPGERRNEVTEMQKAFISLGANIDSGELFTATTAGTYGTSTQTAVAALLDRFGFAHANPPIPFNASEGRSLNMAVGAELGNSAGLRQAVRESFDAKSRPPPELRELDRHPSQRPRGPMSPLEAGADWGATGQLFYLDPL
jgi:peptidoglycan hydrolase-like protein with peptidoglycan-binding domain